MKPFVSFFGLPLGIASSFWFIVGLLRYITEKIQKLTPHKKRKRNRFRKSDIAVVIAAHNEQMAIVNCITALRRILPVHQLYVASDGSTDATTFRAQRTGVHVAQLKPGVGKAKAILATMKRFHIYGRYRLLFIVDADTRIDRNFLKYALPLFNDRSVGVTYGTAMITWPNHIIPRLKYFFVAYRERLNRLLQFFFAYGQTWKYTNVTYVVPGFATIWRCDIFRKIPYDTPGLLVEDFNTAFYINKHKICKIAYDPRCIGWDQHPETLADYWRQVRRWNIGFFQTIRMNGIWPSFYWLSLGVFSIEIFANSIFTLALPGLILYLILARFYPHSIAQSYLTLYQSFGPFRQIGFLDLLFQFYLIDYGLTVWIGLMYKKPQFIFYGLFFIIMHYITSIILISSLIPGFFVKSAGKWVSPKRSVSQMSVSI
jgi:cellulose synthase/poly-beta-1,6-N-acetylglucosamine synthase-like glycosyltransferase